MLPLPALSSLIWLALCTLAVWRVTAMLVYEEGPLRIFTYLRRAVARGGLDRLVTCFHCAAVWVAAAAVALVYEIRWATLLVWLGVAGAVSLLERWLGGGDF